MSSSEPSASASLYGIPRPKTKPSSTLHSSTSHSFASQLNSLISTSQSSSVPSSRPRPSKSKKNDIFTTHNRGTKKRALADISADDSTAFSKQKHNSDIGGVDTDTLHRSKRKMEEKARLYAAMKRGDYVPPKRADGSVIEEREALVDFDRKWAENEDAEEPVDDTSSDESDSDSERNIEFVDEFGRRRLGTRGEVAREERRRRIENIASRELSDMRARPEINDNLIYGDVIQSQAFNPDAGIEAQMASLAAKRDKSLTPPPEEHYDASKEVRTKGVGFYQFSADKEGREKEMQSLQAEREETEKRDKERRERKEKKQKEVEERKRKVREMRERKEAEKFLRGLDVEFKLEGGDETGKEK